MAGLDDRYTLTEFHREQRGLEVKLTPLGGHRLLGLPMHLLRGDVVPWEALMPNGAALLERLRHADWPGRFALVEQLLHSRLAEPPSLQTQVVRWACERVERSGGRIDIAELVRETGYSHKHLVSLFRQQVGVPPKALARLVRFQCLADQLRAGRVPDARLAATLGYSDQAHLARKTRAYAGLSNRPSRCPTGGSATPSCVSAKHVSCSPTSFRNKATSALWPAAGRP